MEPRRARPERRDLQDGTGQDDRGAVVNCSRSTKRELIGERTKAGLAAKKRRGERIGRPRLATTGRRAANRLDRNAGFELRPDGPRTDCRRHPQPAGRPTWAASDSAPYRPERERGNGTGGRLMAHIRTHNTAQRNRRSGKPVKRYEVIWREQATDAKGLPTGRGGHGRRVTPPRAGQSQAGRTQRREATPTGTAALAMLARRGPHVWRVCGGVASRTADKGRNGCDEAEHVRQLRLHP